MVTDENYPGQFRVEGAYIERVGRYGSICMVTVYILTYMDEWLYIDKWKDGLMVLIDG